jgi:hypothetical protein
MAQPEQSSPQTDSLRALLEQAVAQQVGLMTLKRLAVNAVSAGNTATAVGGIAGVSSTTIAAWCADEAAA